MVKLTNFEEILQKVGNSNRIEIFTSCYTYNEDLKKVSYTRMAHRLVSYGQKSAKFMSVKIGFLIKKKF